MTVFVNTGKGNILERKKKVLSNKALTRQVRTMRGKRGKRVLVSQNVLNNISLNANTAQVFKLTTLSNLSSATLHSCRFFVRWESVANSANRIIVAEDIQYTSADADPDSILDNPTDLMSPYQTDEESMHPFSAKRKEKNLPTKSRFRILKDMMWTDSRQIVGDGTNNIIKLFRFDLKLHGRKSDTDLGWVLLVHSDQNNTPIDIQYIVDHTAEAI